MTNRRTFAELPGGGRPDGLTVDADGGVWTAVSNGGSVYRYSADGVLEERLAVPARKVTACTFGGEHLTPPAANRTAAATPTRPSCTART